MPARKLGGPSGCWPGVDSVRGRGSIGRLESHRGFCCSSTARDPQGEVRPVGPTSRTERKGGQAQGS